MKKQLLSLFLILTLWVMTVGCTRSQLIADINAIEAKLPQVAQIATGVLIFIAPQFAPLVNPAFALIAADGKLLESLIAQYKVTQDAGILQKINALYQDVEQNVQGIIAAIGVKNMGKQTEIQTALALIGVILGQVATFVQSYGSTAQVSALTMMSAVSIRLVSLTATDKTSKVNLSARDIAKHWNKVCGKESRAKIPVPRVHILFVPVPFSGSK